MPRRLFLVVAAAVLVALAGAGPAQAKGPDHATISGPGIGTKQLTFDDPDHTLDALLRETRFWEGVDPTTWRQATPPGDLGPAFVVTYHVPDLHNPSSGKADLIRQDVYPFAETGPVVHMAPGQTMYGTAMPAGWLAANDRLVGMLTGLGATRSSIEASSTPVADVTTADDDSSRPWALTATGVGVLALAALTLALLRRRAYHA